MKKFTVYLSALLFFSGFAIWNNNLLQDIILKLQKFNTQHYQEKIYLHTDADIYYAGELIWFNARLLEAQTHLPSNLSKVVHVELYNSSNEKLYHNKILIEEGKGSGDIYLEDNLPTGKYHLRAYTEWMKNFHQDFIFNKDLHIVNDTRIITDEHSGSAEIKQAIDVQFFPEGGSLVQSINNTVGFKATNNNGIGIDINGYILNEKDDTVTLVNSYKYGIGKFTIEPEAKRKYYLHIKDSTGENRIFPLPTGQKDGLALSVDNTSKDLIKLKISVTRGFQKDFGENILLFSHCRGQITFAAKGGGSAKVYEMNIPKAKFKPGINHVTIFNEKGIPLAERLIFIQPNEDPLISISNIKNSYGRKSMVEVVLQSQIDHRSNVTVSVHDRASLTSKNIKNYLLLDSDLKGNIEDPGFYFTNSDSARIAADNLMLTQGWRRFSWQDILKDSLPPLVYIAETEGLIFKGKLINKITGKTVNDTLLIMSVLNRMPNFIFNRLGEDDEFAFAFYRMHGRHRVFVNVFGNGDLEKFELKHIDEYDTLNTLFPKISRTVSNEDISKIIELKKKEEEILTNYRIHAPDHFRPINKQHQIEYPFVLNQLPSPPHAVQLDKFIPLNNLKELFYELVPTANVRRRGGKYRVFVFKYDPPLNPEIDPFNEKPATAFLNGIPTFDEEVIFNLPYDKIEKVGIYTGQYVYDDYTFHGFYSVTTKDISEPNNLLTNSSNSVLFDGLSFKREFYSPKYDALESNEKRFPDLRHLLYWNPSVDLPPNSNLSLKFYTSDVLNEFYITIEGISENGDPISETKKFNTAPNI